MEIAINDISYLLMLHPTNFLSAQIQADTEFQPAFFIPLTGDEPVTKHSLQELYDDRMTPDDVWQPEFLEHVIFCSGTNRYPSIDEGAKGLLDAWGMNRCSFITSDTRSSMPPEGPYVLGRGQTWEPWRIYVDFNSTLMVSFRPAEDRETLKEYDSNLTSNQVRVVVPSRCYFHKTAEKPLAGARIVVKDNFDVRGFKTSLCSRAWMDYHQPAGETAACVQRLVDLGAILVGKTKLQAWVMREEPLECVEFLAPFNPRGDGYQTASGSSNGSGAAVASYPWLDLSLGSDTNGSGRKPAHWNGCSSLRPTHGAVPMDGVTGFWRPFDVPVFYGRDISTFGEFVSAWYNDSDNLADLAPHSVIVPKEYIANLNEDQRELVQVVAASIADVTGVPSTDPCLADLWENDKPDKDHHEPIEKYLELAGCVPYYYDAYYAYRKFYEAYTNKFGKTPFVNRYMRWRWDIHDQYSQEQRDALFQRLTIYKKWLLDRVFQFAASEHTAAVIIVPIENGRPSYRDDIPAEFSLLNGFSPLNISPVTGGPEITVIAGEIPYESRISNRIEPMPIGVSIIGPPGSDLILCNLAKRALEHAEMPLRVAIGRSIFPDGPLF